MAKVYVLSSFDAMTGRETILGVFEKPKLARFWLDVSLGFTSKKKWKKINDTRRKFIHPLETNSLDPSAFFITEWKVVKRDNKDGK